MLKWIKYYLIVAQATVTGKTIVNFLGVRYIVSGNIVKRFG